jgi:signal transduction histidine kinase
MLHRKLKRLDGAATRLGAGDFGARVSELGKHRIGQLNHSFNLMAERLERLILGHKSLTNAVAHELRTPVSRIRFQLDMLYEESDDDQRNEYMYGMSDNINEMTDLVDELLTYARFDREAPAIDLQLHSLHQSLVNVVAAAEIDSNVHVHYDAVWMQANPDQQFLPFEPKYLERAIGNLLSNAQKYSRSQVQISIHRTNHDCTIIVDDDGPGIPEEDWIEIFEPFRRLDNSRTRSTGGYGLGLAIVKQIAEWHSGSIRIEHSPPGGARFALIWPTAVS